MKKIIGLLLLICLSGCMNQEQAIVCSTISKDESTRIQLEYQYANDKKITHIQKNTRVTFNENSLKDSSLKEKYKELKKEYNSYNKIKGLQSTIVLHEEKKQIESIIEVDLASYNFKKDAFDLGNKNSYDNITDVIKEISALGYYRCEESSK